jgi:germination protein M
MAERSRSTGRTRGNAGCLFWLVAFVLVLLLFLLNLGKIGETLKRTNFTEIVRTQRGLEPKQPAAPVRSSPKVDEDPLKRPEAPPPDGSARSDPTSVIPVLPSPGKAAGSGNGKTAAGTAGTVSGTPETQPKTSAKPGTGAAGQSPAGARDASQAARTRTAWLYFVRIDDDGVIVRQEVKRPIASTDSPLSDSLMALLKGPTEDEIRRKLISLIPQGTKLLGVQVRGSTAFLNLSEAFMYNRYGIEGYAGQLKQIVYTATAFPTVQDVQILIEGERHDYLGGEGVYIGRPLARNSF